MNSSGAISVVRVVTAALAAALLWHAGPAVTSAAQYRVMSLVLVSIGVLASLMITAVALEMSIRRRNYEIRRFGAAPLVIGSALALATGRIPGMFLSSLALSAAFVVLLAVIAAVVSGSIRTAAPRFWTVMFCAAAGAAWQVGAAPLLATVLVQN